MMRVAVIGAGAMGTDHARTLARSVSGAQVSVVCDPDGERAASAAGAAATATHTPRIAVDPAAVIGAQDVDAVLVASSDASHEAIVLACLAHAVPVLCEKPLTPTVEGCLRIVAAEAALPGPLVQVGFMRRHDPGYVALRDALLGGAVGAPLIVHNVHRNAASAPWFTSADLFTSSLTHEIDVLRWLTGDEIASVTVHTPRSTSRAPAELRDPQVVVLRTVGGVVATVEVFLNAGYGYEVTCEVVGERGTVTLPVPDLPTPDWRSRFADAYRLELQSWVDGIAAGTPVTGPGSRDGLRATAVALLCVEASHTPGVALAVP